MLQKDKIIRQFKRGYSPVGMSPRPEIASIYNKTFKSLIGLQHLDLFFEMAGRDETILRAWGFLGISHVLFERNIKDDDIISKVEEAILRLLNDESEINYFGGTMELSSSLREHHVGRVCGLHSSLTFKPVLEYCKASGTMSDRVACELLEKIISKVSDPRAEPLIIHHASNVQKNDLGSKLYLLSAFENLQEHSEITEKETIKNIFKTYLDDVKRDKTEGLEVNESKKKEIVYKKRKLQEEGIRIAALMNLDLREETLTFLEALVYPYGALNQVAKRYKNDERFKAILLEKLKETTNRNLISDLIKGVLALKEAVPNWKELVLDHVDRYHLIDEDLILELDEANLLDESMVINYLREGNEWHLDFIRTYFNNNPEKLDQWAGFLKMFMEILDSYKPEDLKNDNKGNFKEKKKLILRIIIDLEKRDLIKQCLDNYVNLEDEELKKIALFSTINLGNDDTWIELRKIMDGNADIKEEVTKFWSYLEARDWKFYY